jgi:hypothetical protein
MKVGITSSAMLGRKATFTADQEEEEEGEELAEHILRLTSLPSPFFCGITAASFQKKTYTVWMCFLW